MSSRGFEVPGPGTLFDSKYRVTRLLGEGGMGTVILARDEQLERDVAIKFVRADLVGNSDARTDFVAEARAMARVRHPHLVEIYAFGDLEGVPYFVMEYVPGPDLHDWLQGHEDGVVTVDEAIGVLAQVCRGVSAMHAQGTIHQDLKPGNILIGPEFRIAVTDFGLAQCIQRMAGGSALPVGTPPFTAPEVSRGDPLSVELAPRVDVYALGVIAYQLLTGCYMFPIDDTEKLFYYQNAFDPMAPSSVRQELPAAFDAPILNALHRDPKLRTATPDAFWQTLLEARETAQTQAIVPPVIVVADDDPGCLRWTELVLRDAVRGARVVSVADGKEALIAVRQNRPSLVICDLEMPELNGIELTATLRGDPSTGAVPIMVMTAVGGGAEWAQLHRLGADEFVVKPLQRDAFAASVRRLLRRRQSL